jgi:hypothetical protein
MPMLFYLGRLVPLLGVQQAHFMVLTTVCSCLDLLICFRGWFFSSYFFPSFYWIIITS